MIYLPFYDPEKTYVENFKKGPFGSFADSKIIETEGEPQFDFFGYKVYAPFGIAAGPLINGNFVMKALNKSFDIVTYKTVRTESYPAHPWPNILAVEIEGDLKPEIKDIKLKAGHKYQEPISITNSFGVPSSDPEFWQKDIEDLLKNIGKGQALVGAFQGTQRHAGEFDAYVGDFCLAARILKNKGVKIFEVNLSCPNEGTTNLLCYDTERSVHVVKKIKEEIGKLPLIIKIGYFSDDNLLKDFIKQIGNVVDGISAINTISAEIVDENGKQSLPGDGRLRSGVCGRAIKWAGIKMVEKLVEFKKEFNYSYTVIGVGGVFTPADFMDYRNAGANFVMTATGAMWNPYLAKEIKTGPLNLKIKIK